MHNAAEEKDVNAQKSVAGRKRQTRLVIWKTLLADRNGRDFLFDFLDRGHMFSSSFGLASFEPIKAAFIDGEANIAREYFTEIQLADPVKFMEMIRENAEKGSFPEENENE